MWAFTRGCMRTHLILKAKVVEFNAGPEIQAALQAYWVEDPGLPGAFTPEAALALKARTFACEELGRRGPGLEQLDQLTVGLLLGVRS